MTNLIVFAICYGAVAIFLSWVFQSYFYWKCYRPPFYLKMLFVLLWPLTLFLILLIEILTHYWND